MNGSMHNHGPGSGEIDLAKRDLDALRAQLDRIDDRLLEDVRARIEVCMSIAHLKRRYSIPVMQPHASVWSTSTRTGSPSTTISHPIFSMSSTIC
ncbi:chorismate mutase [Gordonia paraffinivorans]|uniref:chorismate mutase n=1 Tax=Gordonia paraffinivorans TaxID=175628 RepID=UPI00268702F2